MSTHTESTSLLAAQDGEANTPASSKRERLKKIVVSGVGFFSDAYDLFVINIVMIILAQVCRAHLVHVLR